jgi:hypothetical protein
MKEYTVVFYDKHGYRRQWNIAGKSKQSIILKLRTIGVTERDIELMYN